MNNKILLVSFDKKEIIISIFLFLVVLKLNVGARTIKFAGHEWVVRSGYGSPGPNYWSDSEKSVWVDENGRLHLKIREESGNWYCSEVYTEIPTQNGIHRFYVIGRIVLI